MMMMTLNTINMKWTTRIQKMRIKQIET